jgi:hypothetical protein
MLQLFFKIQLIQIYFVFRIEFAAQKYRNIYFKCVVQMHVF